MKNGWMKWMYVVLLSGLFSGWACAAPPITTTVYPTGSFPQDVQNVQTAIDNGGSVLLKATNATGQPTAFNFGPATLAGSGVNLNTDVTILGEQVGQITTTIKGGFIPILGLVPVESTIQGINFDGPLDSPIALFSSTGANILDNHITGVVPFPINPRVTEIEGIFLSGFDNPENAITGKVMIANNVIEVAGGTFVNGMQLDSIAADIEISDNTVNFLSSNGFIFNTGVLVLRSQGKVSVTNNAVTMGPGDLVLFPNVIPVGIYVGGNDEARYEVKRNTVTTIHPNSDGIDVASLSGGSGLTQKAIVEGNHVLIHSTLSTSGGIGFDGAVKDSLMTANQIEGTSGNAIQILGLGSTLVADSNKANGNDISQLSASQSDVFLGPDSVDNQVAGQCNTYVDLGTGNRVLCGSGAGSITNAAQMANKPGPALGLFDDVQSARFDALRNRLPK
jgi:hypothetical protein